MVDDGEDESQQSLHNDPKVWGRMVALMRGLDFVCFTKSSTRRSLSFFQTFQNSQHKNLNGYKFDEVEVVMFDSRILESGTLSYLSKARGDTQDFDVFIVDSSANSTRERMRLKKNNQ